MATWRLDRTEDGSPTLVHPVHGEACHSRAGAWLEARERHARACRVRERALELAGRGERVFRLLDVGTGLGVNVAAALEVLEGTGVTLAVVSLELERSVIERTLELARGGELHRGAPPELVRWHAPVLAALEMALAADSEARERGVPLAGGSLTLLLGDGRATLPRTPRPPRFDAVFLDAFSPRVDPALWQPGFLAEVAARMAPGAILSTYSVSLGVRAALTAVGLHVAPGGRVGCKAGGTLASTRPLAPAFDERTARRIARRAAALGSRALPAEPGGVAAGSGGDAPR